MKAITICQPYAELILTGAKLVENRTWPCAHRGPLLIHAGKSRQWLRTYSPLPEHMDFGAIVGVCDLVATANREFMFRSEELQYLRGHIHCEGPCCWVLKNVRRFDKPIPYKGMQGLFSVPDAVVKDAIDAANHPA